MTSSQILGFFIVAAVAAVVALAIYGLWQGRRVKPDGFPHRDWLGNPHGPDKGDFESRQ